MHDQALIEVVWVPIVRVQYGQIKRQASYGNCGFDVYAGVRRNPSSRIGGLCGVEKVYESEEAERATIREYICKQGQRDEALGSDELVGTQPILGPRERPQYGPGS